MTKKKGDGITFIISLIIVNANIAGIGMRWNEQNQQNRGIVEKRRFN